jgi:hypothetical protein
MARIIAPFQIEGTLHDTNFYVDQDNINRAREKATSSMTSEKYWTLPIYHNVRMQSVEFGQSVVISKTFQRLVYLFNKNAKDGSFAGRSNKLLFEILKEDLHRERGERLVTEGIKSKHGQELLVGFESNKLRPLHQVLAPKKWEIKDHSFRFPGCVMETDIDWPSDATHVTFNLAIANWNIATNYFNTQYGEAQFFTKTTIPQDITITVTPPSAEDLHLTFLFIGFSKQQGSKHLPLHRKHNTATLVQYHYFPEHPKESNPAPEETLTLNLKPPFTFS